MTIEINSDARPGRVFTTLTARKIVNGAQHTLAVAIYESGDQAGRATALSKILVAVVRHLA